MFVEDNYLASLPSCLHDISGGTVLRSWQSCAGPCVLSAPVIRAVLAWCWLAGVMIMTYVMTALM